MPSSFSDLLTRIQGEYREMPGLRLTPSQARRLWGLDPSMCETVLSALVAQQFLTVTRDGFYVWVGSNVRGIQGGVRPPES